MKFSLYFELLMAMLSAFGEHKTWRIFGTIISFDLLQNELFSIEQRPENAIPKPFVVNDAIIIKKHFNYSSIQLSD